MKWLNLQDNVNLLAIIGGAAILLISAVVIGMYIKQMKVKQSKVETSGEEWDGIGEYKNDLPLGWALSFIALIIWAVWYFLVGYPLNSYSQIGEYNEEVKAYDAKYSKYFENPDQETLQAMGESVFLVECIACHGINAKGINGVARDLTAWGNEAGIIDTIMHGSKGLDYPMGEMLENGGGMLSGDVASQAKAIAAYVSQDLSGIKTTKNPDLVAQGKEQFAATCAACHGEDGKGMEGSSPDLTTYGTSKFVIDVLNRGKHGVIGQMPKFNDGRLTDIQKRAVGEYIAKQISKQ